MAYLFGSFKTTHHTIIAMALLLVAGMLFRVDAADLPEKPAPMALSRIMRDMGMDMQGIAGSIAHEDWAAVAERASRIADHPQPPLAEKLRILAFLGKDTGRFRRHDRETHEAAQELQRAASRQDGTAVIAAFASLQSSCLSCHQNFRQPFQEHFHAQH